MWQKRIIKAGTISIFCTFYIFLIFSESVFSENLPAPMLPAKQEKPLVEEKVIDYVKSEANYVKEEADYIAIGSDNLREGNYEEAVEDFKNARERDPKSSIAAYYLGIAYKKLQDHGAAKIHRRDAISLTPPVKESVAELADVLYQLGELEETLNILSIAEKEGIESAQTTYLRGVVLLKLGLGKAAIRLLEKAKSMDERLTLSADYQIALANLQEGNFEKARDILKEIVIRDPNSDLAQYANQYIDAITKQLKEESPLRLAAGLQYQYDNNVILKPGDTSVAGDITDEADSLTAVTLRGEYVPKLKGPLGLKAQSSLKYLRKEYQRPPIDSDEDRDSDDSGLGISWFYLIAGGKGFINTRYDFIREDTDGSNWRYKGNKIGIGLLYPVIERLKFNAGGEGYFQDFENTHTAFSKKRDDTIYSLYTLLTYSLRNNIDLNAQYVFIRGDSNIALYDYDKSTITIGIEARLP